MQYSNFYDFEIFSLFSHSLLEHFEEKTTNKGIFVFMLILHKTNYTCEIPISDKLLFVVCHAFNKNMFCSSYLFLGLIPMMAYGRTLNL